MGKKYEAYASIFVVLHNIKRTYEERYVDVRVLGRLTDKSRDETNELCHNAFPELIRYADVAEFILSQESCSIIRNFANRLGKGPGIDDAELLEERVERAQRALDSLVPAAKRDLSANGGAWWSGRWGI